MYPSLTIMRNGNSQGQPFFEVYSPGGQMIASGPLDHCTSVMRSYLA